MNPNSIDLGQFGIIYMEVWLIFHPAMPNIQVMLTGR
jgi:hypothetical protein